MKCLRWKNFGKTLKKTHDASKNIASANWPKRYAKTFNSVGLLAVLFTPDEVCMKVTAP